MDPNEAHPETIFHQLTTGPSWWTEDEIHWLVEYWDPAWPNSSLGSAYIVVRSRYVLLQYIYVQEEERRQGIASAMVRGAYQRWPALKMTGVTEPGRLLMQ